MEHRERMDLHKQAGNDENQYMQTLNQMPNIVNALSRFRNLRTVEIAVSLPVDLP